MKKLLPAAVVVALVVLGAGPANAGATRPLPVGHTYSSPPPAPAPASCHTRALLPDPHCTPGATNPAVYQSDIASTICHRGWTSTVRPPESYTEALKRSQMRAYGDTGSLSGYEEDHLVPLELGGAPSDPRNLWPEPGASPNAKDKVENAANRAVCEHRMALSAARLAMATNWVALGRKLGVTTGSHEPPTTTTTHRPATGHQVSNKSPSGHYYKPGEFCPERDLGKTISGPYGNLVCKEPAGGGQPHWYRE